MIALVGWALFWVILILALAVVGVVALLSGRFR